MMILCVVSVREAGHSRASFDVSFSENRGRSNVDEELNNERTDVGKHSTAVSFSSKTEQ